MGKKIIIEYDYIIEDEMEEIDFDLNKELRIDYDNWDEISRVSNDEDCYWAGDSHPVKIDRVLKVLNKLKKKCKYVEIMYHEDHISYIFSGLNIRKHVEDSKGYKKYANIDEEEIKLQTQEKIKKLKNELKQLTGN